MKLMTGILILIANLWQQIPAENVLQSIFEQAKEPKTTLTAAPQQDPPDDGTIIIQPPPR
jgi:hypothetical protein